MQNTIVNSLYEISNELNKASLALAKACVGKRTKEEMREAMKEVSDIIYDIQKKITG